MHFEPQPEHRWLEKFVGNWRMENECLMAPDQPPQKGTGKDSVRKLGDAWILCEGEGESPDDGQNVLSLLTLGYDPAQKCFVGTFVCSVMTHLWIYENGQLDETGKILTLNAMGPNFTGEGMAPYQDIFELVDDNHRILRSQVQGEDGTWTQFMTAHYYRT